MNNSINLLILITIFLVGCQQKETITPENTEKYKGYSSYRKVYDLHTLANYQEGLACAKKSNLPLFLQFTGHGCVGYDEFQHHLIKSKKIRKTLNNNFITVILYVDDRRELENLDQIYELGLSEESIESIENKKKIGTLNARIQVEKFQSNSQPLYVLMTDEAKEIIKPFGRTKDETFFLDKLNEGLNEFKLINVSDFLN